jgi:hypothetical protein
MDGTGSSGFEPGFDQFDETALAVGCGGEDRLGDRLPHVRRVSIRMVMRIAKQGFIDWPTDASGMRRQFSPAADIASDRLW